VTAVIACTAASFAIKTSKRKQKLALKLYLYLVYKPKSAPNTCFTRGSLVRATVGDVEAGAGVKLFYIAQTLGCGCLSFIGPFSIA